MSCGIIKITKSWAGESWENTYAYSVMSTHAAFDTEPNFDDAVDAFLGTNNPSNYSALETDPTNAINEPAFPITRLLHWERAIHSNIVTITGFHISDGLFNTPAFRSVELSLPCSSNMGGDSGTATGNVALMIRRTPVVLGARQGRGFFRLALRETEVYPTGIGLVALNDVAGVNARIAAAAEGAGLANLFWVQTPPTAAEYIHLAVPHYETAPDGSGTPRTNLVRVTMMSGWGSATARSRQVMKGKKRKAA